MGSGPVSGCASRCVSDADPVHVDVHHPHIHSTQLVFLPVSSPMAVGHVKPPSRRGSSRGMAGGGPGRSRAAHLAQRDFLSWCSNRRTLRIAASSLTKSANLLAACFRVSNFTPALFVLRPRLQAMAVSIHLNTPGVVAFLARPAIPESAKSPCAARISVRLVEPAAQNLHLVLCCVPLVHTHRYGYGSLCRHKILRTRSPTPTSASVFSSRSRPIPTQICKQG